MYLTIKDNEEKIIQYNNEHKRCKQFICTLINQIGEGIALSTHTNRNSNDFLMRYF